MCTKASIYGPEHETLSSKLCGINLDLLLQWTTKNKVGLSGLNNRKHIAHMKEDEIHLVYCINELPSFELFPFLGIGLEGVIALLT